MKNLNPLKYLLYTLCMLLLFVNCETDKVISGTENSLLKKGRLENYSELATYVEKLQHQDDSSISAKDSSLEINNGFDILYDQDMFIQEIDSSITYSIPIHKNNQLGGTFSNLVVRFSDTEPTEAFILNYEPTDEYIDAVSINEQTPFEGNVSSESIDYDGSLDSLEKAGGCVTVTTKYCDWDNNQHGDTHLGGDNCTPGYYWYVTTTICFGDEPSLVDVPTPGSGDPSATDYIYTPSTGGGISSGDTVHPPIVVPNVPKTYSILKIDGLSLEMSEWLNQPENYLFKQEMIDFLDKNNWSDEAKEEVKLTIQAESISESHWDTTRTGIINGKEALTYIAAYDGQSGGNYTMYKLANGHVLCESTTRRKINPRDANTIASQDYAAENYYYVQVKHIEGATDDDREDLENRWYTYRMPPNSNGADCVYCDIEYMFQTLLGNASVIAGRYVLFVEDGVILITGKDFDKVESSRAVAGTFIVLDIIGADNLIKLVRFLKHADEVVDVVEAVYKYMDEIFKTQKKNVDDVLDGTLDLNEFGNTTRKGNYGEMHTDVKLTSMGYEPLHRRITDIDEPLNHGIDGVFKNPNTGEYLIVESKYNTSELNRLTMDGKQMSDNWIQGITSGNNRLVSEVGEELAEEIMAVGYQRIVSRILPDGTNYFEILDSAGNIIEIWYP